jgi:hypothetical protein
MGGGMNDLNEAMDTFSQILWRCAVIGYVFVLIWFGVFYFGSELIYRQGQWFGLTPHECALVAYCGMGFTKVVVLVFFLAPFIAIRLVLRKRRR